MSCFLIKQVVKLYYYRRPLFSIAAYQTLSLYYKGYVSNGDFALRYRYSGMRNFVKRRNHEYLRLYQVIISENPIAENILLSKI